MVFYTASDLERQICFYMEKLNLDLDGVKIKDCITTIIETCPKLHSFEEIREYALRNLKAIEKEYGYKGLRIFYWSYIKQDLLKSFQGDDMLEEKYDGLINHMKKYHRENLLEWIELQLDYMNYSKVLEEVYNEEYGNLTDRNYNLFSTIKVIHNSNYNQVVVEALQGELEKWLSWSNGKYYLRQDLSDHDVLELLYEHVVEESFLDNSLYQGHELFYDYDGYGGTYFIDDYTESWSDENGYHARIRKKPSGINDYQLKGSVDDF